MRLLRVLSGLILLFVAAVIINRLAIPGSNTAATHFDAIIVLGYPATANGLPTPEQRTRVLEGVSEYRAGVAPHMIMTGGPAHNAFVEAHVMTLFARQQGVPAEAILEEPLAQNTIQNIYYSSQIMQVHGWRSAEVVSSDAHIARAAMILPAIAKAHPELTIAWRTHAAPWPPAYSSLHKLFWNAFESSRCLLIRIEGFPDSKFLPRH